MSAKDNALTEKAVAAMRVAIRQVISDHERSGRPLAVWEHGRVVMKPVGAPALLKEEPGAYDKEAGREGDASTNE